MADFGLELSGLGRAVLRFDKFPDYAHDRLLTAMQNIEKRLEIAVIAGEPDRTGLLKSQTGGRVYDHGTRIAAVVGVRALNRQEARKAAALEFGSHRRLLIKAHWARLSHFWGRMVPTRAVWVETHPRTSNIDARRFMRGALDALRSDAIAEMKAAIAAAAADAEAAG